MKHNRLSVNQICFPGATIAQLESYWQQLQLQRVSCLSTLLENDDGVLADVLSRNRFQLETIAHVFLSSGNLSISESVQAGRARLTELIRKAEQVNAHSIYMMTGGRGNLSWEQAADSFSEAIAPCIEQAKNAGIKLAIENAPAVYADVTLAHTLRDAIALAEMAGIGICIELFACWAEAGLRELFERALPRCVLVQVSDYVYGDRALPARAVPGDGVIPLRQIVEWLQGIGYRGAFDLEIIGPRIDREGCFPAAQRAANYLDQILRELLV
ncbi:MAG: TIM barrel protein [Spongiibacteraceae bacterium]